MALYNYIKAPSVQPTRRLGKKETIVFEKVPKSKATLGGVFSGIRNDLQELLTTSRIASLLIPMALIFAGAFILYRQVTPTIDQKLKEASGYYDQGTVSLVEGEYISLRENYLSNPGANYFQSLTDEALQQHILKEDPISNNYQGTFYLTIQSLGLTRLKVTANVDSGNEKVYKSILNSTLAHFNGTGLPISPIDNNMVIYGHSASGDYFERTKDYIAAFSRLSNLKIGDEIKIEMENKTYLYKVSKSKIVEPEDVSIINGTSNKRTLTLFTCYPNGSNGKRYVAIAKSEEV